MGAIKTIPANLLKPTIPSLSESRKELFQKGKIFRREFLRSSHFILGSPALTFGLPRFNFPKGEPAVRVNGGFAGLKQRPDTDSPILDLWNPDRNAR